MEFQNRIIKEYVKIGDSVLYGGKHAGSDAEHQGSEYIAKEMQIIGLENIEKVAIPTSKFQFNDAEISVITSVAEKMTIKPYGYVAPGTTKDGISAELVDVGSSRKSVYENLDIKGKIVLIQAVGTLEGTGLSAQFHEAILNGAVGILTYAVEDVLNKDVIRVQPPNILPEIPILGISINQADYLKRLLRLHKKLKINIKVDAVLVPNGGTTYNIVGEIPGAYSDEKIIFTGHLDHYFRCIQDNISSVATLLGIAKAMIDSGYKPKRTIIFALHGSHETGMLDSKYPYISGSYKLLAGPKKSWTGKALVDINFEYSALKLNEFRVITSIENIKLYEKFLDYIPKKVPGYETVAQDVRAEDYYILSWADTISYISQGVPIIINDAISEQIYAKTSPYIGRDHSNYDNFEVYSEEAARGNTGVFGALAIYIDNTPALELDFTGQVKRIRAATNFELLTSLNMDAEKFKKSLCTLEGTGSAIFTELQKFNTAYIEQINNSLNEQTMKRTFRSAEKTNEIILRVYKSLQETIDKIAPLDFIIVGHQKYTDNIMLFQNGIELLKSGNVKAALDDCILNIDLARSSYSFSKVVVQHISDQVVSPKYKSHRTWAQGKELSCLTLYEVVESLKSKYDTTGEDYTLEIKMLEFEMATEINLLSDVLNNEIEGINQATAILQGIDLS